MTKSRGKRRGCICLTSNSQIWFEILGILIISGRILLLKSTGDLDFCSEEYFFRWVFPLSSINHPSFSISLATCESQPSLLPWPSRLLISWSMAVAEGTQYHVLAVDDSIIDRKLIERLLKFSSYQVTAVDSVSKALEFLGLQDEQTEPTAGYSDSQEMVVNLIITDYCMPEMTGYELLRKVKESSSLRDIPVVIMSSDNIPSRISRCLEEGAEEYLLKPVQMSDVNRLLPQLLKGKSKGQQRQDLLEPKSKRKVDDETLSPASNTQRYNSLITL